jgi:hypothetical protein
MITFEEIKKINFPSDFGTYTGDLLDVPAELIATHTQFACGISKLVIFLNDSEVVKVPFDGGFLDREDEDGEDFYYFEIADYCEREAYFYDEAIDAGVEEFFAKTEFAGYADCGRPLYKSERVFEYMSKEIFDIRSKEPSQKAKDSANNSDCYALPFEWLARAYDYYGEEKVEKLIAFLNKFDIRDLHDGNIGFRKNGAPVLLDYSDYREDY